MQKIIKKVSVLSLSIMVFFISCSKEDNVTQFNNATSQSDKVTLKNNIDDYKSLFNQISEQKGISSQAEILSVDDSSPLTLNDYLAELNKTNESFDFVTHLKMDTKQKIGIIDVYSLRYANNPSKFLVIYEGDFDQNIAFDLDMSFTDGNNLRTSGTSGLQDFGFKITGGQDYPITNPNPNVVYKFDSKCFKKCIKGATDTDGMMGMMLWGLSLSSYFCPPCGAVAAVYGSVVVLGCAGGCNH